MKRKKTNASKTIKELRMQWNTIADAEESSDVPMLDYQLRKHAIEHKLLRRLY
jgi:hypothetical protein